MGKFLPFSADFAIFGVYLQFRSLVLAENFQKSTSKFVEGYMTTRTHEKIQNQGLRSTFRSACAHVIVIFLHICSFWSITSNFIIFLAENFLNRSPKCLLACMSSGTCGKIQNLGFYGPKWANFCHFSLILTVFGV